MRFNVKFNETNQRLNTNFNETKQRIEANFGNIQYIAVGETSDYTKLTNKPKIEGVTLQDNKSFIDLGLTEVSNQEILEIAKKILGGN